MNTETESATNKKKSNTNNLTSLLISEVISVFTICDKELQRKKFVIYIGQQKINLFS